MESSKTLIKLQLALDKASIDETSCGQSSVVLAATSSTAPAVVPAAAQSAYLSSLELPAEVLDAAPLQNVIVPAPSGPAVQASTPAPYVALVVVQSEHKTFSVVN